MLEPDWCDDANPLGRKLTPRLSRMRDYGVLCHYPFRPQTDMLTIKNFLHRQKQRHGTMPCSETETHAATVARMAIGCK